MKKRPAHLQRGDKVGIVAPSSPPSPDTLAKGIAYLEELGLECVLGEALYNKKHYLAGTDNERARDIETMLENPEIKAIFCASGGVGAQRTADKLDFVLFEENPKIFWGFSDITFLHTAIGQLSNLVTFHGPTISSLGYEGVADRTKFMLKQLFTPAEIYYDESISPLTTVSKGRVRGQLTGGNLSLIASSLGTKYAIDTVGKVLLLEGIGLNPAKIDALLQQLKQARKLEQAAGFVIGDFTDAEPDADEESPTVEEVIKHHLGALGKPVVRGFKIGHDHLNVGIPLGVDVILDADEKYLAILPGVE